MTDTAYSSRPSPTNQIRFGIAAHAAWAPGRETPAAWQAWAAGKAGRADAFGKTASSDEAEAAGAGEPSLKAMPAMLRRRASAPGKMALETAYAVYPAPSPGPASAPQDIPVIFCSRHGECGRSADLLLDLARAMPLSPTAFSLSVHNATGGLFSIARRDHANSLALAAGHSTAEHAVIEACSLLADGAPAVLLAMADGPLPAMYRAFADCDEQPFGWAWLLTAPGQDAETEILSLGWSSSPGRDEHADSGAEPGGLQVMRFFLSGAPSLERRADRRLWTWRRDERPEPQ